MISVKPEIENYADDYDWSGFRGKTVEYDVGWDGGEGSVMLSDLIETAVQEYPGVPFFELAITISQESRIVLHLAAAKKGGDS